jgi:GTP-binding protein YchF
MKIGIIGLPQSGKTTIFNAAAGRSEAVGDYSKASHRAIIKVPDHRLDRLGELEQPKKVTHAEIDYLDISAFSGKGKEADAGTLEIPDDLHYADELMFILDCFSSTCSPERHFHLFMEELILADQIIIERNIEKRSRTAQLTGDKAAQSEVKVLQKCLTALEESLPLSRAELSEEEVETVRKYSFLSIKPLLVVLNIAEDAIGKEGECIARVGGTSIPGVLEFLAICGKVEMELAELDAADRGAFLEDLGIESPAMERLIQKSYELLGLVSFFTVGPPEARAWTIREGTKAPHAAGHVHSDMERGFIRAEVITYEDFDHYGSTQACKEAGKYHVEGKDYVVRDGDVILFRFNV